MPLHALKGHSGVPACGGGSLKADGIPAPTPPHYPSYEHPPLTHPLYRVCRGGGGVGVGMASRHPNAQSVFQN